MGNPTQWMCPNMTHFLLKQQTSRLEFQLTPVEVKWNTQTMFRIWEIDLYVEPNHYRETGLRNALRNIIAEFAPNKSGLQKKTIWVSLSNELFFDFHYFDTSGIDILDLADHYPAYFIQESYWNTYSEGSGFFLSIVQDRQYQNKTIAIKSVDVILGIVGGLSSIVWGFLYIVMGGYQEFKLENSLIGTTFPTSRAEHNTAFEINSDESKEM